MTARSPFSIQELVPQAERLETRHSKKKIQIGIPRESHEEEKRICLTPDAVSVLTANGHRVIVETGAGAGANYSDHQYAEAGAELSQQPREVFSQPIVLKIEAPTAQQIQLMASQSTLISALRISSCKAEYFKQLAEKKITAIAMDLIEDEKGDLPITQTLSEIAGTASVLIASSLMSNLNQGNGVLLGSIAGVSSAEVVILGAGTVGEFAARASLGLGASVKVFDHEVANLRRLQNHLNQRIFTSLIDPKRLTKALRRCDLAIGAIRTAGSRTPVLVSEEMVKKMKPRAVIVDVSIDRGGAFETSEVTTHKNPSFIKHDVIHYGVTNIASRVSRTASIAMSNYFLGYLMQMGEKGGFDSLLKYNRGLRKGIYLYKGVMTRSEISQWFDLPFNDIDLLLF